MEKPKNCVIVIFGASGDLTKRKLISTLFDLFSQKLFPEKLVVLGVGRTLLSDETFRINMLEGIEKYSEHKNSNTELKKIFSEKLLYLSLDTSDINDYSKLKQKLSEIDLNYGTNCNYIFYLATPPKLYETIFRGLSEHGLNNESQGSKKIVIEKPFGYDLQSALELNNKLHESFRERQIYRIDHYLGKETVQNILVFRFSNSMFEPLWNQKYIDYIEITSSESIGVEDRGGYYDNSGALRDMIQNHMLQLVGIIAMEPPASFDANSIRNETLKVFQSVRTIKKNDVEKNVIRGQYTESNIHGEKLKGYRDEKGVSSESRTETFVAMKLLIDNWRWSGTPFYIRTGKRMPTRVTEIVVHFKQVPFRLFSIEPGENFSHNQLIIRIQPDEGILLKFGMKLPGSGFKVKNVNMDFHYSALTETYIPTAYERLILDCMLGDPTLYTRADAVEACWKIVDPILNEWDKDTEIKVYGYPAGTWGPEISHNLIQGENTTWRFPCKNLIDDGMYCEL